MPQLSALTAAEATEMLHCRLQTIEAFMCEYFEGFYTDIERLFEKNLASDLTATQKTKILTELAKTKEKYYPRGGKK